jgi:hypothetical protein
MQNRFFLIPALTLLGELGGTTQPKKLEMLIACQIVRRACGRWRRG